MGQEPQATEGAQSLARPAPEINTAEDYIRQALADADSLLERVVDPKTGNPNHIAIAHYISKFPAVVFLEALRRRDPQEADRLAVWVQKSMEDGETAGELNWQWSRQIADGHPMTWLGGEADQQPPIPAGLSTTEITTRDGLTADVPYVPTRTPGLIVTQTLTGSFDGADWKRAEGKWGITHEPTLLRVQNWDYPLDVAQSIAARLGELNVDWTQVSRDFVLKLDHDTRKAILAVFEAHDLCSSCSDGDHQPVLPFRVEVAA
ncbi:hypothetical protein [Lentzea sp. NPDC092896]|uniref:hypothetical protein n=1 Tax=Lentzea sp. NPDC092896 TaxID=3364127 RepID=UPI0038176B32